MNACSPAAPPLMDWESHFPAFYPAASGQEQKKVEVLDVGCGFGGLLVALAPLMPDTLLLGKKKKTTETKKDMTQGASDHQLIYVGLEIRSQVAEFVRERIKALRVQQGEAGLYQNASCIRANSMKFLANFFDKGQLSKIFICFPDPHFKTRKHKARIVTATLNSEYAFVLRPGGIVYTITDVEDLHLWMVEHFDGHPSFERVGEEEQERDECVEIMRKETEEGKKVERNNGLKFVALYRRLPDPPW